jgi:hypothetical protein
MNPVEIVVGFIKLCPYDFDACKKAAMRMKTRAAELVESEHTVSNLKGLIDLMSITERFKKLIYNELPVSEFAQLRKDMGLPEPPEGYIEYSPGEYPEERCTCEACLREDSNNSPDMVIN